MCPGQIPDTTRMRLCRNCGKVEVAPRYLICDPCRRVLRRARKKAWYKAHPEQLRARAMRKYRKRHPPQPDQSCVDCQQPTGRGPLATRCLRCWRMNVKLKDKFGITRADFNAILADQGGVCAICRGATNGHGKFHVDHDHKTGRLRGLLCATCNMGLGRFGDDASRLLAAAEYLTRSTKGLQGDILGTLK